jgi:hypothetical protein
LGLFGKPEKKQIQTRQYGIQLDDNPYQASAVSKIAELLFQIGESGFQLLRSTAVPRNLELLQDTLTRQVEPFDLPQARLLIGAEVILRG